MVKKKVCFLIAALMAFLLVACGSSENVQIQQKEENASFSEASEDPKEDSGQLAEEHSGNMSRTF